MKILLAGPGTGKTTNIREIIKQHGDGAKFLILSFTNATVNDLQENLKEQGITESNCMTLHKFAMKYNHDHSRHVLLPKEMEELKKISKSTEIDFIKLCDFLRCTTFDQMIERFVNFAKANPNYLEQKLSDYDSLIVDEYQDFNPAEQNLIDVLLGKIKNTYILGDDDQCIYDFKDASSDKIISFHRDASNNVIPHQHICYRCPDKIVEHATKLIKVNKKRVDKQWNKSGKAGDIKYSQLKGFEDVANEVISEISTLKVEEESILILTPVRFAIEPILNKLQEKNLPFTNYFVEKISEELLTKVWEVRALFGNYKYLNLVLLGYSKLSNRKKFYDLIKSHFDKGENYDELIKLLKGKLPTFMVENKLNIDELLALKEHRELLAYYQKARGNNSDEKLENLFRHVEETKEENIKIMSIHKSKGLGADHVFIVGLNEGIIPNKKKGNDSIESQRRLFYVGITRTKKQLFLYSNTNIEAKHVNKVNVSDFKKVHPKSKIFIGKASTFITEMELL